MAHNSVGADKEGALATLVQRNEAKRAAMAFFSTSAATFGFSPSLSPRMSPNAGIPIGEVVGVGLGAREAPNAGLAGEEVVRVYVTSKASLHKQIPKRFGALHSDVVEVGDVVVSALLNTGQRMGRHRPTSCGVSVGHPRVTAGTLGCRVRMPDNSIYILSNNHVLANSNATTIGDAIIQPGSYDGGTSPADDIAKLSAFQPIDFTGAANDFDAAIAQLDESSDVESDIIEIGAPGKVAQLPNLYQSVRKHGRTTGHTVGVIVDTSVSLWIGFGSKKAWFQDQIAIQGVGAAHFSAGGDSGSLIVDAVTSEPVGLLFAGSSSGLTFANPIGPVLNHFGVTID